MSTPSIKDCLQQAQSLSERILQKCEAADWQGLDALEQQRQIYLQALDGAELQAVHRASLQTLLACNEAIVEQLTRQRTQVHENHRKYRLSRQASRAYQQHRA